MDESDRAVHTDEDLSVVAGSVDPGTDGQAHLAARFQAELRQSEVQYRQLVELSPDLISIHCDDRIVFINSAGLELLGATSSDQVVGHNAWDFMHPDYAPFIHRRLKRMKLFKRPPIARVKLLGVDGREIEVEISAGPFVFLGKPAIQVFAHDVTDRLRSEREIAREREVRDAEGRLRLHIASMDQLRDIKGIISEISTQIRGLGVVHDACTIQLVDRAGKGHLVLGAERDEDWQTLAEMMDEFGPEGRQMSAEHPRTLAVWRSGEARYEPVVHFDGGRDVALIEAAYSRGTLAISRQLPGEFTEDDIAVVLRFADVLSDGFRRFEDLAERLLATRKLEESEERFRKIFQDSSDANFIVDADARFADVNDAACAMTDYSREELLNLSALELSEETELLDFRALFGRIKDGETTTSASVIIGRQGRRVQTECSHGRTVIGGRSFIHTIARDISERKQAEAAQRRAEDELKAQRALSMRSDRLRSLGEMAAGIAHELNQPLVGVRGLAEHSLIGMERGWALDEEQLRERFAKIIEQADRMVHIIQHVRMFAREAGKPDTSDVNVNEVAKSGMDLLDAQFRSRGITLQSSLADDPPAVKVNPFSLEEVLINLLNNARDAVEARLEAPGAARDGLVVLRSRVERNNGGTRVSIEVEDNGGGIPEAVIQRVFDPFFTTKDPDKGTGLGLSVSKSIVEDAGGSIGVESTSGQGTVVRMIFPAANGVESN